MKIMKSIGLTLMLLSGLVMFPACDTANDPATTNTLPATGDTAVGGGTAGDVGVSPGTGTGSTTGADTP